MYREISFQRLYKVEEIVRDFKQAVQNCKE